MLIRFGRPSIGLRRRDRPNCPGLIRRRDRPSRRRPHPIIALLITALRSRRAPVRRRPRRL